MKLLFSQRGLFVCKKCGRKMLIPTPAAIRAGEFEKTRKE
jgi:hypothetical protein